MTERLGSAVATGPFMNMIYRVDAVGSSALPKLIGSYESELHPMIRQLTDSKFNTIVDVGCAEGYYAVGLALLMPEVSHVYAFDTDPIAREECRKLAQANGVGERVVIKGECRAEYLDEILAPLSLLIMDCEGCEEFLLDLSLVPNLRSTTIVVECHDFIVPQVSLRIAERFRDTHSIENIRSEDRNTSCYPLLGFLSDSDIAVALCEFRPPGQQWTILRPKKPAA